MWRDYQSGGRSDQPGFLCAHLPTESRTPRREKTPTLKRQARHVAAGVAGAGNPAL